MTTNSSANEQATPAAVSATKPAHTPSAGAMRAAKAVGIKLNPHPLSPGKASELAQIIDRETAHAELVEFVSTLQAKLIDALDGAGLNPFRGMKLARIVERAETLAKAQA